MKKTVSLTKNVEFKRLYKRGNSFANSFLVIYFIRNKLTINRLGITVNKKVGKAVIRNKVKRLIKESYRLNEHDIKSGYDIIFVSRVRTKDATFVQVNKSMKNLLNKSRLINNN